VKARVLLGVGLFLFIWSLTTHGKLSDTGDEPHYLTIARSLVRDGDLDLANNYAAPDSLTPMDGHARPALDGRLQSIHDIGLPVLLVPIYAVSERLTALMPASALARFRMPRDLFEYSIVSLFVLACVCVAVTWLAAALERVTTRGRALFLAVIVGASPPVLTHSFLVFPDTVAFIVMCGVVWWMMAAAPAAWTTWVLAGALGYLPWCHRKFSFLVVACVVIMVATRPEVRRTWSLAARVGLASLVLLPWVAFYWWTWETWGRFGGALTAGRVPLSVGGLGAGLVGLLMDRQSGLVADAPIYLSIFSCWALATPSTRRMLWVVASLVVPSAAFEGWWAGFSPAARYLVPVMPFLAIALADSQRSSFSRGVTAVLAVAQAAVVAAAWHHPRSLWPRTDGTNPLLHALGPIGQGYAAALPDVRNGTLSHAALPLLVLLGANAALVWLARRERADLLDPRPESAVVR
jgi:hypothetical protein